MLPIRKGQWVAAAVGLIGLSLASVAEARDMGSGVRSFGSGARVFAHSFRPNAHAGATYVNGRLMSADALKPDTKQMARRNDRKRSPRAMPPSGFTVKNDGLLVGMKFIH